MTTFSAEQRWTNWAGSLTYTAREIVAPASIAEMASVVAEADQVHALGTRHSFSDVADAAGVLIDLSRIPLDLVIDEREGSASMSAAASYGQVAPDIDRAGFALHNEGSLPHISVGGATATGTHGSGTALGSLSTAVRALELLGQDGSLQVLTRDSPAFRGSVLHLGLLGVVTRVTLDLEPSYRMRQDAYGAMPWDTYLEWLPEIHDSAYSVSTFTTFDGTVSEMLVKTRIPDGAENAEVAGTLYGAPLLAADPSRTSHTARDGTAGPWWDRLPHFPIHAAPSVGSELQSEHFVPMRHAAAALEVVRAAAPRLQPLLHVCELRTMAGDDLWLSPSQGEAVLCIAFTWKKLAEPVAALLSELERKLLPFDARPHWGKLSLLDSTETAALYPLLPEFRELASGIDPNRKFSSSFGTRVLDI
ncbi:FAD-binding protein [Pseudoclavibacter sp. RFBA6]|uniref:FAD-binding protein n=1 Tax=Pseudoclavibacter sp. RFBA6 TaxID=2080573 RepID=UPI0015E1BEAA|nr:FAD-binding protein [Pseudoclavibacter sp. RFBA6]